MNIGNVVCCFALYISLVKMFFFFYRCTPRLEALYFYGLTNIITMYIISKPLLINSFYICCKINVANKPVSFISMF